MTVVGKGTPSYTFERVSGAVRHFRSPTDVIDSLDSDLESTIALVASGGTTFLSPILGRLGGIVCLDGTLRSHLAIVSREFEVPCLVGTSLEQELQDGTTAVLDIADGAGRVELGGPTGSTSDWWDYVRRVGDEIAVKDFDVTLSP